VTSTIERASVPRAARSASVRRVVLTLAILTACRPAVDEPTRSPTPVGPEATRHEDFLVAVGDIACAPGEPVTSTTCHHERTAALLGRGGPLGGQGLLGVLLLGDVQYETGTPEEYASFDETWGTAIEQAGAPILPVAGNHEYGTSGVPPSGCVLVAGGRHACGFAGYFSTRTDLLDDGDAQYVVTFDGRHPLVVVAVDVGACEALPARCAPEGPVVRFLRAALADPVRNPAPACTIVAWHQARWSEVGHGDLDVVDPVWRALFDVADPQRPDLVLNGHDHVYERYPQLGVDGAPDPEGIPELVVGTGGREIVGGLARFAPPFDDLEAIDPSNFGVLRVGWDGRRARLTTAFVTEDGVSRDPALHRCRT
jgi:Calcineurin-like phosphoesterase